MFSKNSRNALSASLCMFFASCGGGSGDGGSNSPRFFLSTNSLDVGIVTNSGRAPDQSITGTVSNYSGALYIYITHTDNGIESIYTTDFSGDSGTATISMQNKTQGVYFDNIIVQACADVDCNDELPGSPQIVDVTYHVGIAVYPSTLEFSANAGEAPESQTVTVYYGAEGSGNNWSSSYMYLDGAGWMDYSPYDGTASTPVDVTLDAMPIGTSAGTYNAQIIFGANAGKTSVSLPIQYTVY
ncbi:MAG: hypothetical protein P8103_05995 [Candidatus Thiodiazotropha sp.]